MDDKNPPTSPPPPADTNKPPTSNPKATLQPSPEFLAEMKAAEENKPTPASPITNNSPSSVNALSINPSVTSEQSAFQNATPEFLSASDLGLNRAKPEVEKPIAFKVKILLIFCIYGFLTIAYSLFSFLNFESNLNKIDPSLSSSQISHVFDIEIAAVIITALIYLYLLLSKSFLAVKRVLIVLIVLSALQLFQLADLDDLRKALSIGQLVIVAMVYYFVLRASYNLDDK